MDITETIRASKYFSVADGVNSGIVQSYQKMLNQNKILPIPFSYAKFLERINGIYGNGVSVFGVNPVEPFEDIFKKNILGGKSLKDLIFLGESLTDFLCYDWNEKSYVIMERKDREVRYKNAILYNALLAFLKEYF